MIEEPTPLTIRRPSQRPNASQIAAFQGIPTSFVVDAMWGAGALGTEIAPLPRQSAQVAGPALTVDNRPSDILALLAATQFIAPGDIVVSAFAGFQGCAAAGDRVSGMMRNCGAAGFVTDGPMRDLDGLRTVGLPSWCTGLNPGSPFSTGPGKIGLPIRIGGQAVESGDMIVADTDGVVVVPFAMIDAVANRIGAVSALEEALDQDVADGLQVPEEMKTLVAGDRVTWVD